MKISENGIAMIKHFEGCRLKAYKPLASEKYFTIGYGHCSTSIKSGDTITIQQADAYLRKDLENAEKWVNKMLTHKLYKNMTQNQFDALVSFTFNCGTGNLVQLHKSYSRTLYTIGQKIVLYNKSGGRVIRGLVNRRKEEQALYLEK